MAEKKEQEVTYKKTEIATQVAAGYLDTRTNKVMNTDDVLIEILNKLDKIEKSVA